MALVVAAIIAICLVQGCTNASASRISVVHTALNVITDVADPAYETARLACKEADNTLIHLAETGKIAIVDMEQGVARSRERCDKTFNVFDQMSALQQAARAALDLAQSGDEQALNEAEQQLKLLRELWTNRN